MTAAPFVGRRMRRMEDPALLRGRGRFVDDAVRPGLLHAAFVRSPAAHARILSVDVDGARAHPGVAAVLTADDLTGTCSSWRGLLRFPGMVAGEQHALATGKVRAVGEPIVLVVAVSRAVAEDAAELVVVDLEPLPPVIDPVAALAPDAPLVHDDLGTNLAYEQTFGGGDVDAAFARAALVVEVSMSTGRHTATAIETRGVLADADPFARTLTVRISSQAPHMLQSTYAGLLGLAEKDVRVITEDVGGSFGMKAHVYPDEIAVCAASLLLGRPVKWIQDRIEALQSDTHARDERVTAALALDATGRILGLRADVVSDTGAYSMYPRSSLSEGIQTASIMPGPYRVDAYHARLRSVITTKAPLSVYRGVGHPVAILVMESLLDEAARRLDLPAADIRRRNLIGSDELPYTSVTGHVYDSGSHREALERLLSTLDLDAIADGKRAARARGRLVGLGLATFVEVTALGPRSYGAWGAPITAHDQVQLRMEPDGSVVVLLGTPGQGQGLHTAAAQVVADHLGVDITTISVISGDTATVPHGSGVWASRSAVVSAGAAAAASRELRARLLTIAGHLLEASPGDLVLRDGVVTVDGVADRRLTVREIAEAAHWRTFDLPPGTTLGLTVLGEGEAPAVTFNNGAHAALVEVDPALGTVRVLDYVAVEDCGVLINPDLVDEQIRGGIAQGLGGALLEHLVYDEDGQLVTSTLLDYHLPSSAETVDVRIEHIETPSPLTALGTKGAGEAGAAGAPAAIHNAVNDALAQVGARVWHQPLTPERVVRAVVTAYEEHQRKDTP